MDKFDSNVKIIRTSIIGFDKNKVSLLSWFLNNNDKECSGFTNHFWNGVTTLQWAKYAEFVIDNWDNFDKLNLIVSDKISKYDLLCLFSEIFNKDIKIIKKLHNTNKNKCLIGDNTISLYDQLLELKKFYK